MDALEAITTFFSDVTAGSIVGVIVLILSFIEIVPVKVSPLAWIGKRVNKETLDKVKDMDKKLDQHIAQEYRTKIMDFQTDLIRNGIACHTLEEWKEVITACTNYESYCADNNVDNGFCVEAMSFIRESYHICLNESQFASIANIQAQQSAILRQPTASSKSRARKSTAKKPATKKSTSACKAAADA